jgi:macrolide-specific efflux system membrane fusion protein
MTGAVLFSAGCQPQAVKKTAAATPTAVPAVAVASKPTYTVQRGDVVEEMKFSGRVVPVIQQELYFKVSGRVRKVYMNEGDTVKAGDLIADLESAVDLQRQGLSRDLSVQRAQIQVDIAQADLDIFLVNASRAARDFDEQLLIKQKQVELARIGLAEAKMNLEDLTGQLTDSQILAPFDGKILTLSLTDGKLAEGYAPVVVIANVTDLEISSEIDNVDLNKLSKEMALSVYSLDNSDKIYPAKIRRMPYLPGTTSADKTKTASSLDTTTRITLGVPLEQAGLKLGSLVNITVIIASRKGVLWLPPSAIRVFESRNFVVVKNGVSQERVDLKIGIKGSDRVEILSGVQEGQLIIAP